MSQFIEMFGNPVTNTKGWKTAKIKDVAPEMPSKEQLSGKIWLLNLDMIESNTGRIIEKVYEDVENALSVQSFDEGNVLFSKLRPYLNKVVIPDGLGMATTELVPLRPEPSKLHKVFLSHLLRGNQFVNYANDIAGGTKMPRMPLTELRNFDCILPPMDKQLEFVFIAEQADKSKFGDFKSQFIEMFDFNDLSLTSPANDFSKYCKDDTSSATKIVAGDYLSKGIYPIYDQSKDNTIAGYTNKKEGLCDNVPAVLFGDHSRVIKYINTPFFIGADGVKIIRPKINEIIPEFLYYDLKYHTIPNTGYNRHFKFVKMLKLTKASMEKQNEFLLIARQADKSKSVIQKALVYLNDIQSDELGKIA